MHKGLDVFLKDLGVFLKAERVLKKDLGLFLGGGCCMKYHQLNTLFYVSLQLIVKQCFCFSFIVQEMGCVKTNRSISMFRHNPHFFDGKCKCFLFLISKNRIFLHCFIHAGANLCNYFLIIHIRKNGFNHFGNFNHQIFFCTASCNGRSTQADTRSLEC